jgi:hypothetical protein
MRTTTTSAMRLLLAGLLLAGQVGAGGHVHPQSYEEGQR